MATSIVDNKITSDSLLLSSLSGEVNLRAISDGSRDKSQSACMERHLVVLENSSLYDRTNSCWHLSMDSNGSVIVDRQTPQAEILSVLLKTHLRPVEAFRDLQQLRCGPNWDSENKEFVIMPGQLRSSRSTGDQLLGIVMELKFEPECALERFKDLKDSPAFDRNRNCWRRDIGNPMAGTELNMLRFYQIIIESGMAPESSRKLFDSMFVPETSYDPAAKMWRHKSFDPIPNGDCYLAYEQLLAVYAAAHVDLPFAKMFLNQLKDSNLFDRTSLMWRDSLNADLELNDDSYNSRDQLMGLLVECEILRNGGCSSVVDSLPRPMLREF